MNSRLPPLRVRFGRFEERMLRRIARLQRQHPTCSPKKKHVIRWDYRNDPASTRRTKSGWPVSHLGFTDRRAFANLVRLGLILHARNGHCWQTDKGRKYLQRAKR